ncbi:hypothetical protein FGO68_gene8089 [Halteria grandinella]|uniref:TmcB/TmcC TPR repeats domain-containing protein n=1 Tax=Halteria grandinella TaxID=5974 RepID=A0A8J8NH79_HALGN|nr:hypothetical protein FGO68_gene8089 [Halteria grandinella]
MGRDHLFKINYVLLYTNPCIKPIYHILMLFEFLQMVFLTFYGWSLKNGFVNLLQETIDVEKYIPKLIRQRASDIQNVTEETMSMRHTLQSAQTVEISDPTWRMEDQVKFSNPALYLLDINSKQQYLGGFWASIAVFYALIISLVLLGGIIYQKVSAATVTSATKIIIRFVTMSLILFQTVLQIPFFTLLLQAFNCGENPLTPYAIKDIECNGSERPIILPFALVTMVVYCVVYIVQMHLMERAQFGSQFAWAGRDRLTCIIRLIAKLLLLCGFIFDKNGESMVEFMLPSCVFLVISLYRRYQGCNYYDKSINTMHTLYDIVITYHLFFVSIHILANKRYQISGTIIFILTSLIFHQLYYLQFNFRNTRVINKLLFVYKASSNHCEMYLQLILDKFITATQQDQLLFFGLLYGHVENCREACMCEGIIQRLEKMHQFDRLVKKAENLHLITQNAIDGMAMTNAEGSNNFALERNSRSSRKDDFMLIGFTSDNINRQQIRIEDIDPESKTIEREDRSKDIEYEVQTHSVGASRGKITKEVSKNDEEILQLYEEIFGHPLEHETDPNSANFTFEISHMETQRIKELSFKFFALLLDLLIDRFPTKACHRLHLAELYKFQLSKQFKAIFEIVGCQFLESNDLATNFQIFQLMGQIEQELQSTHMKQVEKLQQIDVVRVYDYNRQDSNLTINIILRAFLDFQRNELLGTSAALKFWRELQQKEFNAKNLQNYGHQISRSLGRIQDAEREIARLCPDDMKFYFRYGMFLINVINNDQDGIDQFKKIQTTFTN